MDIGAEVIAVLIAARSGETPNCEAITAICSGEPRWSKFSNAVIARPASGILDNSPPKPIGSNNKGSNLREMASHSNSRLTAIITACPHCRWNIPIPLINAIILSIDYSLCQGHHGVTYGDSITGFDTNAAYGTSLCSFHFSFHFHGFENE